MVSRIGCLLIVPEGAAATSENAKRPILEGIKESRGIVRGYNLILKRLRLSSEGSNVRRLTILSTLRVQNAL